MVDKMTVIKDDDENKCNVNKITNVNVDNIIDDEEQSFITDKDLPLSFNKGRHLDIIGGINCITQTWRMKERVSFSIVHTFNYKLHRFTYLFTIAYPTCICLC